MVLGYLEVKFDYGYWTKLWNCILMQEEEDKEEEEDGEEVEEEE